MLEWLFKPSCPCDPAAKEWVEARLEWLAAEFPDSAFTGRPVVLPTDEYFPDRYDRSEATVRALLDRTCGYMDVAPELVDMELVAESGKIWLVNEAGHYLPGAAGTYQEGESKFLIRIDRAGLDHPMDLVGTMAHELAHVRILGESRASHEEYDNELLTDLTVCHFGLGVFLANTPRNWESQNRKWPDSELVRPEYMSPPMFGWALAHLAWFREEERPGWARHLHPAARANFKQGIRYLAATKDSWHRPPRLRKRGATGDAS